MVADQEKLKAIAEKQYGYFSAVQAKSCGFGSDLQFYHFTSGNWEKLGCGLFRLDGFEDSPEAEFTRWTLWSRNQKGQPQGIISHDSALAFHGLGDYPNAVHLTVPKSFRKKASEGCVVHKDSLKISSVESHTGFMVTRPGRTLADLREQLEKSGAWEPVLAQATKEGILEFEDGLKHGIITDKSEVFMSTPSGNETTPLLLKPERKTNDPVTEGVWNMIFSRTQVSRFGSKAGFTLVELLVVISIISILASLLLPALKQAKDTAYAITCANQQRQFGLSMQLYAEEHDGILPPCDMSTNNLWTNNICNYLATYLGFDRKIDGTYVIPFRGYVCPSDDVQVKEASAVNFALNYHYNMYFGIIGTGGWCYPAMPVRGCKKVSKFRKSSQAIAWVDGMMQEDLGATAKYPMMENLNPGVVDEERHNGRANFLFVDTHVETAIALEFELRNVKWDNSIYGY